MGKLGWAGKLFVRLVGLCLAGCQPVAARTVTPAPTFPQPAVRVVELTPQALESATAVLEPTQPRLPDTLEEMAENVYGARLIDWIELPAIQVRAPVRPVGWEAETEDALPEWDNPEAEVGWVVSSALPGDTANIVLYGHNNIHSSVFQRLAELESGDGVVLQTGQQEWRYTVDEVEIIAVSGPEQDSLAYQKVLQPSTGARLTLLSCWPPDNNTHRVIVTAYPENAGANR
jgi:LPXTG-site transpeptidase (sortase) family protein